MPSIIQVPQFDLSKTKSIPETCFDTAYNSHQALLIRGFQAESTDNKLKSSDIQSLFQSLDEKDKSSWCIENKSNGDQITPADFLDVNNKTHRGYCSFLAQHSISSMDNLLNRLPLVDLPVECLEDKASETLKHVKYGPCIWFFFGKNYCNKSASLASGPQPLLGRPEHTDSVSHDGTWHFQLSGTKVWRLRPTDELLTRIRQCNEATGKKRKAEAVEDDESKLDKDSTVEVECKQGDILLLNTRLWWHSTLIPMQESPSISYARDVYFQSINQMGAAPGEQKEASGESNEQSMTNVDGTYASQDIEASTILFTEHTMPDCELHRSKTNPNCQVVELEDDETGESYMAVVSLRAIKTGEFFCVMESDSEEEDGEEEEIEENSDEDWQETKCRPCPN